MFMYSGFNIHAAGPWFKSIAVFLDLWCKTRL